MKLTAFAAAGALALVIALSSAASASSGPTLTQIEVLANDGGEWITVPSGQSYFGIFELFVARNGDPVNGSLDSLTADTLPAGTTTYGIIGTDGNGPGTTQQAFVTIDGSQVTVPNHGSTSFLDGSSSITIGFDFTNKNDGLAYADRVAVDGIHPDGYQDSYGTMTFTVGAPTPASIAAATSQDVTSSAAYQALSPGEQGAVQNTLAVASSQLAQITSGPASARQGHLTAYGNQVDKLVKKGVLSSTQAAQLKAAAASV